MKINRNQRVNEMAGAAEADKRLKVNNQQVSRNRTSCSNYASSAEGLACRSGVGGTLLRGTNIFSLSHTPCYNGKWYGNVTRIGARVLAFFLVAPTIIIAW